MLCIDPDKNIDTRPASRRLLRSVADYVNGGSFRPSVTLEPWQIKAIFNPETTGGGTDSSAAVKQLLNK